MEGKEKNTLFQEGRRQHEVKQTEKEAHPLLGGGEGKKVTDFPVPSQNVT